MKPIEICQCGRCLRSVCQSSDSGLTIGRCWCAECAERRAEIKAAAAEPIHLTEITE